jgi:hypothetical protein
MLRFVLPLILTANVSWANIGEVAQIQGSGVIKRQENVIQGEQGSPLQMQDTIATAQGNMNLHFNDNTRVDVTEHSRMVIDEFVYDPRSGTGSLSMKATLGAVRYASGSIAKNNRRNVDIQTPSATIGVRGTDFVMIVDELGGSMITLLPSCNDQGMCVTGEITVASDTGTVTMNQAFQTTVVQHRGTMPSKPLTLELPEDMLNSMLIVRKTTPYEQAAAQAQPIKDVLDIDFLKFNELERDYLKEQNKNIWATDLDNNTYLNDVYVDQLKNLMREIVAIFQSSLDIQNAEFLRIREQGLDPQTGIYYANEPPQSIVSRQENTHNLQLDLSQDHGYNIDIIQNGFSIYNYRVGVGNNSIYIKQTE